LDEHVLLFIKMRTGHNFTRALAAEIKTAIRTGLSARHVPSQIFEVQEIPVRAGFFTSFNYLSLIPAND
jgi:acetoacetyl-CoA synthetase